MRHMLCCGPSSSFFGRGGAGATPTSHFGTIITDTVASSHQPKLQTSCIKKSKLFGHYCTRSSVKPSTLSSQVTTWLNIRGHDDFDEIDCLDVWNAAKLFLTNQRLEF